MQPVTTSTTPLDRIIAKNVRKIYYIIRQTDGWTGQKDNCIEMCSIRVEALAMIR